MKNERPVTGEKSLDFEVVDSSKKRFRLEDHLGQGRNTMLVLYRGHW